MIALDLDLIQSAPVQLQFKFVTTTTTTIIIEGSRFFTKIQSARAYQAALIFQLVHKKVSRTQMMMVSLYLSLCVFATLSCPAMLIRRRRIRVVGFPRSVASCIGRPCIVCCPGANSLTSGHFGKC